jgi:uncharacterized phage-associated protein
VRADNLASVIISRHGSWVDALTLQKLLYYAQAWHLAVTDRPLFEEEFEAWEKGPVVPEVRESRMAPASRDPRRQEPAIELDETASGIVDLVLATYGSLSGPELSELAHVEIPWLEARGDLPESARSNERISKEAMSAFYREHRRLDGRTAADLAAVGVIGRMASAEGPVDVDGILSSLGPEFDEVGLDEPIGGSSLDTPSDLDFDGIEMEPRHAYAGF